MLQYRVQTSAKVTPHGPNSFGKHKETVGKAVRSPDVENLDIPKFMFRKFSFPIVPVGGEAQIVKVFPESAPFLSR